MAMADADDIFLKFAQRLAANEKKIRDKALKKLNTWIEVKSASPKGFVSTDMLKIWKGLHYCMWMSDKPLVQEDLAYSIAIMMHRFSTVDSALLFIDGFFQTECREWHLIDRLRLDKFLMMVRQVFKQSLILLNREKWNKEIVERWLQIFTAQLLDPEDDQSPISLKFHIMDIYLDEITNVGATELTGEQIQLFLEPYCLLMATTKNMYILEKVETEIFRKIIDQLTTSYHKTHELQDVAVEDESEEDQHAGIDCHHLQYDVSALSERLFTLGSMRKCVKRNRHKLYAFVTIFENMKQGIYPVEEDLSEDVPLPDLNIEDAVKRLAKFEKILMKKTGKIKRKRKKTDEMEHKDVHGAKMVCKDLDTDESQSDQCVKPTKSKLVVTSQQKDNGGKHLKKMNKKLACKKVNKKLAQDRDTSNTVESVEKSVKQPSLIQPTHCDDKFSVNEAGSNLQISNEKTMKNGEIEIWIPSKKYQKKNKETKAQFIEFTPDANIPQALYRRSARTSLKNKLHEKHSGTTPNSEPLRRVKFMMSKNLTHGFDGSPRAIGTFDPNATPEQSILKSTPLRKSSRKKKPRSLVC